MTYAVHVLKGVQSVIMMQTYRHTENPDIAFPRNLLRIPDLIMTILTFGMWAVFVWIPITIYNSMRHDKAKTRLY